MLSVFLTVPCSSLCARRSIACTGELQGALTPVASSAWEAWTWLDHGHHHTYVDDVFAARTSAPAPSSLWRSTPAPSVTPSRAHTMQRLQRALLRTNPTGGARQ